MTDVIYFMPLLDADTYTLDLVRKWRNRPDVRNNMVNNHEISMKEHERWLAELENRDDILVWIAYSDGVPFGQVNLSKIDTASGTTDWGIYIGEPDFRGKGLGKVLLFNLMHHAFERMGLELMHTRVLKNNSAAIQLYEKVGFRKVPNSESLLKRQDGEATFISMSIDRTGWEMNRDSVNIKCVELP